MSKPTGDAEHGITMEALEQLGKNRPGRSWLRDNVKLWEENAELYETQAANLREMAGKAQGILDSHKTDKPGDSGENGSVAD